MTNQKIVGVVTKNSLSYVKTIFDCYLNNQIVVVLRNADDSRITLTGVTQVIEPDDTKDWFEYSGVFPNDDRLAQIAFTSGTEGEPKGVLLTHQALADVTTRLNQVMELDASVREYVGVPVNFSFGLGRFRAVAVAGGKAFLPPNGFDPLEIKRMLEAGEINAVSAVPSLWRVLFKNKKIFGKETERLKWIEIGSQYMSRQEKEELKKLFPNAVIAQHYGLTEASRTTFLRIDKTTGEHLESVGSVLGQTEIKIADNGCIAIKGPHVARQLLKNGEYVSNVDEDGWFYTSDLGRIADGYLYYTGRADDLINCGGIKLSPEALERDIRDHLQLKEGIAIAAIDDEMTGQAVLVAALESVNINDDTLKQAARDVLNSRGINNRNAVQLFRLSEFPLTGTNKVKRKELAVLYKNSVTTSFAGIETSIAPPVPEEDLSDDERMILAIWQSVLRTKHIGLDDSFYDMGGDSLSAITALIEMESKGIPAHISKGMLQGLSIREIAARINTTEDKSSGHLIRNAAIRNSMTINIVRGLMVISVILAHWHLGFFERLTMFDFSLLQQVMAPFFAMSTPGFAIIYGVSVGYALFPLFFSDNARLRSILHKTFIFLLAGITLMSLIHFWHFYLRAEMVTFTDFTNSFYSVLMYYLLMTATLYFWFVLLAKSQYPVIFALFLASVVYLLDYLFVKSFAVYRPDGLLELIKLLFTGKYAYFQMLSGSLMGLAAGIGIQRYLVGDNKFSLLYLLGISVFLFGVIVSVHQPDAGNWFYWPVRTNYIWRWLIYVGFILILLAAVNDILRRYNHFNRYLKFCLQAFSIIGMLAFPLFVLHEIVMPVKSILTFYGVSGYSNAIVVSSVSLCKLLFVPAVIPV